MCQAQEDIFYYITVMNENYHHPDMPPGVENGILRGMYLLRDAGKGETKKPRVQLLGSGAILREVIAAADLLATDFDVAADVWSVTSFNELRRDGLAVQRYNLLHPEEKPRVSYVEQALSEHSGPVVAATDYVKTFGDQIRPFIKRPYHVLGTDGYGRSDYRRMLRQFFEVNREFVALAALKKLADAGTVPAATVSEAIRKYGIDPNKPNPLTV
ncbi:MAG: pyruvate dehydrogenase (acetyl-transferring), homodimeric type, partial [Candidatus Eremiobacteraeota bacterium]|nr:pyruvate dehydrogenase (acetyl-transferring), homodimeric type [Candidatus Eremiobacteraeota bacterium]